MDLNTAFRRARCRLLYRRLVNISRRLEKTPADAYLQNQAKLTFEALMAAYRPVH